MTSSLSEEQSKQDALQKDHLSSSFVSELHRLFESHEISLNVRVTSKGLFVADTFVERFLATYQAWLQKKTESSSEKSLEKCKRRIFGQEKLVLYYLIEGKRCLSGNLTLFNLHSPEDAQKAKIPFFGANLQDAVSYIHPRDPKLAELQGVKSEIKEHQGLVFSFANGQNSFEFGPEAVAAFRSVALGIEFLAKELPSESEPLLEFVVPLVNKFKTARPLKKRDSIIAPVKFCRDVNIIFWRLGGLIFVCLEHKIVDVYGVTGDNLKKLVLREVEEESKKTKGRFAFGIELPQKKGRYLGKFAVKDHHYFLYFRALAEFIRQAPQSNEFRKIFGGKFCIGDVFKELLLLVRKSKSYDKMPLTQPRVRVGKTPVKLRESRVSFRRAEHWEFIVENRNVIYSCTNLKLKSKHRPK